MVTELRALKTNLDIWTQETMTMKTNLKCENKIFWFNLRLIIIGAIMTATSNKSTSLLENAHLIRSFSSLSALQLKYLNPEYSPNRHPKPTLLHNTDLSSGTQFHSSRSSLRFQGLRGRRTLLAHVFWGNHYQHLLLNQGDNQGVQTCLQTASLFLVQCRA